MIHSPVIPALATGAELADAVRLAARRSGLSVDRYAAPLASNPGNWLNQLAQANRPKPHTVARIVALLDGTSVAPPPAAAPRTQKIRAEGTIREKDLPPVIKRDPCLRCGVRADLHAKAGCKKWIEG